MFFEEMAPLILFILFGLFTFIMPFLRQRKRIQKQNEMKKSGDKKLPAEKGTYTAAEIKAERDRMREKLLRRNKAPKESSYSASTPSAAAVEKTQMGTMTDFQDTYSVEKTRAAGTVPAGPFRGKLASLPPFQKAIVLSEILGKPKALEE